MSVSAQLSGSPPPTTEYTLPTPQASETHTGVARGFVSASLGKIGIGFALAAGALAGNRPEPKPEPRSSDRVASEAFAQADEESGHTDGLLTQGEAYANNLIFRDPDGDGFMAASEIHFFSEADRAGGGPGRARQRGRSPATGAEFL